MELKHGDILTADVEALVNTVNCVSVLGLMNRYLAALMDPFVSLLEIHKLIYFMQEAGEGLKLRYGKGIDGPYAENLCHVLSHIEGYFIQGYADAEDDPRPGSGQAQNWRPGTGYSGDQWS